MTLVSPEGRTAPRQQLPRMPAVRGAVDGRASADAGAAGPRVTAAAGMQVRLKDGSRAVGTAFTFGGLADDGEHMALAFGDRPSSGGARSPLVGVHTACLSGEVLGSLHCDCGALLQETMRRVHDAGGILLYLRPRGRGAGAGERPGGCARQARPAGSCDGERAVRTAEADGCRVAAEMLAALGLRRIALLTGSPEWAGPIARHGIAIDRVAPAPGGPVAGAAGERAAAAPAGEGFVTPREYEVLRRVAMGQSNPEIASAMFISRNTVKSYLQNVLQKLHARNRVEAIAKARQLGIPL